MFHKVCYAVYKRPTTLTNDFVFKKFTIQLCESIPKLEVMQNFSTWMYRCSFKQQSPVSKAQKKDLITLDYESIIFKD